MRIGRNRTLPPSLIRLECKRSKVFQRGLASAEKLANSTGARSPQSTVRPVLVVPVSNLVRRSRLGLRVTLGPCLHSHQHHNCKNAKNCVGPPSPNPNV